MLELDMILNHSASLQHYHISPPTMKKWVIPVQLLVNLYSSQLRSKCLSNFYRTYFYSTNRLVTQHSFKSLMFREYHFKTISSGTVSNSCNVDPNTKRNKYLHMHVNSLFGNLTERCHHLDQIGSRRCIHSQKESIPYFKCKNLSLELGFENVTLKIPFIWLRDHCRSEKCFNNSTQQKIPQSGLLAMDLTPAQVSFVDKQTAIAITWKDGHVSTFHLDWLVNNFYPGPTISKHLFWDSNIILKEGLPSVFYDDHMTSDIGLHKSLSNLVKYGFTLVEKTPLTQEATQAVAERITHVLQTVFGKMWTFKADASRSDTAYTTQYLGAHTDNTYLSTPAGIQVFHCLEHEGLGGETLLVDGFNALAQLKALDSASFSLLTEVSVPHEYRERPSYNSPGYHLYTLHPIATVHPGTGEFISIRFNPYDRAPLNTISPDKMAAFYSAYDKLSGIISNKKNELWIKLNQGTVLLIDNWRVLHGRAAYDGNRIMCGCYLPRDEWVSKARMMGIL